ARAGRTHVRLGAGGGDDAGASPSHGTRNRDLRRSGTLPGRAAAPAAGQLAACPTTAATVPRSSPRPFVVLLRVDVVGAAALWPPWCDARPAGGEHGRTALGGAATARADHPLCPLPGRAGPPLSARVAARATVDRARPERSRYQPVLPRRPGRSEGPSRGAGRPAPAADAGQPGSPQGPGACNPRPGRPQAPPTYPPLPLLRSLPPRS